MMVAGFIHSLSSPLVINVPAACLVIKLSSINY